ncbi:conjugal transfer protein TrbI [Aggregatibacter actinomycetemcomitans serotype e str. SC936]|uniref:type IV secretion system protein VirB10 n=1 Tax=Aggregatibacter actinomycetemcomitans TaxID=714 RepID=UPI00077E414A|nr:type IV secretion system protein VirB10 [Aggregatibacter actinomycetemcomitans]KYK80132.1 conjugal transfer protein TrbI [Aggregatibacter actinomycetemcomitans serotype e str. SC936]
MTKRNLLDDDNDLESQIRRELEEQNARNNPNNKPKENISFGDKESGFVQNNRVSSAIKDKKKPVNRRAGLLLILFALLLFGVFVLPKLISPFKTEEVETPTQEVKSVSQTYRKPEPIEETKVFTFDEQEPQEELLGAEPVTASIQQKLIKSASAMMVKTGSASVSLTQENQTALKEGDEITQNAINQAQGQLNLLNGGPGNKGDLLGGNTGGSDPFMDTPAFTPTAARKSQFNPNLLLEQGTLIPCVLRVKVISNIGGQASCIIANDVYSANGNVLLIEKGSRVNGFYQGNSVEHGHAQLAVVWQEMRTMNNLVIPLHSGSTDELGANGLTGWVDNHFWERFSNAVMLSLILDSNNILVGKIAGNQQRNTENTRQATQEVATTVLEQMGDIKPTLYKNQGDKVGIFVARDIDFSGVYQLKRVR